MGLNLKDTEDLTVNGFIHFTTNATGALIKIANEIGKVANLDSVPLVQTLIPQRGNAVSKSSYSGNFGFEEFPLHTDMANWYIPPKYILLRCLVPSDVSTNIIHTRYFFDKQQLKDLNHALFRPRRRLNNRMYLLRLKQGAIHRWDPIFLTPANDKAVHIKEAILKRTNLNGIRKIVLSKAGECLLIDNWNVLHGRDTIGHDSYNRKIERIYLTEVRL